MAPPRSRPWGPILSLLVLSPLLIGAPWFTVRKHYELPEPVKELVNPVTSLPQLSEVQILSYAQYLSEGIGYRTVGTSEHALADKWLLGKVQEMKKECEALVNQARVTSGTARKLECEVWRQEGSGSHRFDMMGKRLYKTYVNLSNIIVRVSDGTPEGKEHAVLVNAHLDSTVPSPGAADDALSVGVMLECIRVLTHTPGWEPKHAIIFLFNHAEESLQDASQLYSTQHPTAKTVRAFINLEAAGTEGRELLFQATSEEMIKAYSKVPRPFGTVLANEVFSSGVLLSDTDFRQFELYLNITGLDLAVVGNSYLYHTRKDLVEHIQPGVAQHMADNTLALLHYLSEEGSPLPSLTAGYHKPSTVFFTHLGQFFLYSANTAKVLYGVLAAASLLFVRYTYRDPWAALKKANPTNHYGVWTAQFNGVYAVSVGFLGALLATNGLAAFMHRVLDKNMSWFSVEMSALALYGPPAIAGAFATQLLIPSVPERSVFTGMLLTQAIGAFVVQLCGFGSAVILYLSAVPLLLALVTDHMFNDGPTVSLWTYAAAQLGPLLSGTQVLCTVFDVFVPLTGRIGREAPAEHIIATLVAVTGAYTLPLVVPFAHRYGPSFVLPAVMFLHFTTLVTVGIFSLWSPFDTMHQRRLFVLSSDNITSHERYLHIGAADGAPGLDALVYQISEQFGVPGTTAEAEEMNDWNGDWDILYPFSSFMSPYKIPLPIEPGFVSPFAVGEQQFKVEAVNDKIDEKAGTRSFTLKIVHPGIIWTVVAFDAHVLKWTLDDSPPDEYTRHHVKEGSFYGVDTWSMDMVVKIPEGDKDVKSRSEISINFMGMQESGMWPGKKRDKAKGGHAMVLFEKLDTWLTKHTDDRVDAMLVATVGGVVAV
ncbi:hypothetical protein FA95DRAFT_1680074 [Auriscalpium vulgare]|uniref:Uncharacterized protein n=1 Tax=Auriscalpium vulgare TaxID=40419 RepID=A0ACB8RPT3_9AGAM|nr:hypothetical protein FA95DRAFT_1680074 [Auriscalpium vulgare]